MIDAAASGMLKMVDVIIIVELHRLWHPMNMWWMLKAVGMHVQECSCECKFHEWLESLWMNGMLLVFKSKWHVYDRFLPVLEIFILGFYYLLHFCVANKAQWHFGIICVIWTHTVDGFIFVGTNFHALNRNVISIGINICWNFIFLHKSYKKIALSLVLESVDVTLHENHEKWYLTKIKPFRVLNYNKSLSYINLKMIYDG